MEIQTPDWVKHAIFYQIFPDRFAQSERKKTKTVPHWESWDSPPTLQGYKGGDLWGVIENLDYLQDLGINAIYFTPIFQSACNHRYHTHDYYQVDPILGGNVAFLALLKAAHERQIKIVLDGVFNHASRGFFFFNDILENGPYSPWVDWFKIEDWPLSPYDGGLPANYKGWANNRALPEFNHANSQVREYIMQIAEYWIKLGIDGWRLDVPFCIDIPGFWQEFRQRVKAINPNAYIVGEVWGDSRQWLDGTQFDGVMNYLFTGPTIAFTAGDRVDVSLTSGHDYEPYPPLNAREYGSKIKRLLSLYPWEIQLTQLNLLNSHDTARLISIAQGDRASVELATLLLLTFPGAPSIYYGDEVGLEGGIDPDCRRAFPNSDQWDYERLEFYKKLIGIRYQYEALRTGSYEILYAEEQVYVFARIVGKQELIVAINSGIESANICFSVEKLQTNPGRILYGTGEVFWNITGGVNELELTLNPRSGLILASRH